MQPRGKAVWEQAWHCGRGDRGAGRLWGLKSLWSANVGAGGSGEVRGMVEPPGCQTSF